jgi:5'-nucleotidase (lipoprotein e(P4) family)
MATTRRSVQLLAVLLGIMVAMAFMPLLSDAFQAHAASKLKVNKKSVTIEYGQTAKVTASGLPAKQLKNVTWKSSDTKIAKVTKKGKTAKIVAEYNGECTITAKYKKQTAKVKVTVKVDNPEITGNALTDATAYALLYQESAEVAAMQIQAFNLAKLRLDEAVAKNGGTGNGLAIVTDIDSTIMDDTCYIAGAALDAAGRIALGLEPWNNDDWKGYYHAVATDADGPIPGALEFMQAADKAGVKVFYITNRPYYELDLTVKQLDRAGFPVNAEAYEGAGEGVLGEYYDWNLVDWDDPDYYNNDPQFKKVKAAIEAGGNKFVFAGGFFSLDGDFQVQVEGMDYSSKKTSRRNNVRKVVGGEENIIMYLGDSINDMVSNGSTTYEGAIENGDFDRKLGNAQRTANASKPEYKDLWGSKFIVLPNATYGDWYKSVWKGSLPSDRSTQAAGILSQMWDHSYLNDKYSVWYTPEPGHGSDIGDNVE